jgi:hypothetical protein
MKTKPIFVALAAALLTSCTATTNTTRSTYTPPVVVSTPTSKSRGKAATYMMQYGEQSSDWYILKEEKTASKSFEGYSEGYRYEITYSPEDRGDDFWILYGYHTLVNSVDNTTMEWHCEIPFVYGNFEHSVGNLGGGISLVGDTEKKLGYSFSNYSFGTNGTVAKWGTYSKGYSSDFDDDFSSNFDADNVALIKECGNRVIDYLNRMKSDHDWENFAANTGSYTPLADDPSSSSFSGLHSRFSSSSDAQSWVQSVGQAKSSNSGTYYLYKYQGLQGCARVEYNIEYDPWSSYFWIEGVVHPSCALDLVFTGSIKFYWNSYSSPKYAQTTYFNRLGKNQFYVNSDLSSVSYNFDDTISSYTYADTTGIYLPSGWDEAKSVKQSVVAYNWAISHLDSLASA